MMLSMLLLQLASVANANPALGDRSKALENLTTYARRVPDDANVAKFIDAICYGNVNFKVAGR